MSSNNKFARGTARIQFRPSQGQNRGLMPLRPCPGSSTKRIPPRQGKDGSSYPSTGGTMTSQEESFQLLPCSVPDARPFAMIIRLQPEMLEELKQAELEGHESMIKFGAYATGHEIKVGSETFSFSSAPEPGDLCDIYEQKVQENGENILMEAGSAWRKLSVQRILSATEKDRVKQRTAEAEKRQRLRKSILVDPSTQRVISSTSVSEGNRKLPPKITKEPPPKKRKVASPIPFQNDTYPVKGRLSTEKMPIVEKITTPEIIPMLEKIPIVEKLPVSEKLSVLEKLSVQEKISGAMKEDSLRKDAFQNLDFSLGAESVKSGSAANMTDLRNFLISFLLENPKGVTIKAIGKAVGEGLAGSQDRKVIEKVINSIATYQAPGRYLLNPGVEKETVDAGRAKEMSQRESVEKRELSTLQEREVPNSVNEDLEYASHKEASDYKEASDDEFIQLLEDDDKTHQDNFPNHNSAAHEPNDINIDGSGSSSSSESGSDSESDSSASGSSDSGSGSGSGSDSSSSGESMDEEVDIMSDDDAVNKTDVKQKSKRDIKGHSKEGQSLVAGEETQENEFLESNLSEPAVISGQENGELITESSKTLMDTLFGMDETGVAAESFVSMEVANSNHKIISASLVRSQNNKEQRQNIDLDEGATGRASGKDEQVDMDTIGIENTSAVSKDAGSDRALGNKLVFNVSQSERHKFTLTHRSKDTDRKKMMVSEGDSDKKEYNKGNGSNDKLAVRLESDSSVMGAKQGTQKSNRATFEETGAKNHSIKPSTDPKKSIPKSTRTEEFHEIARVSSETPARGKSPREVAKLSDRFSDPREFEEQSVIVDSTIKKDMANGERVVESSKLGVTLVKHNNEKEAQQWQQRDARDRGFTSNVSTHHTLKDFDQLVGQEDRDPVKKVSKELLKIPGPNRQSVGLSERVRLDIEKAERPLNNVESSKRRNSIGKGSQKEAETMGRLPIGDFSKETANMDRANGDSWQSSYSQNRSEPNRVMSHDFELGEFRDVPYENDVRKPSSRAEEDKGNGPSEVTSRGLVQRKYLSPDINNEARKSGSRAEESRGNGPSEAISRALVQRKNLSPDVNELRKPDSRADDARGNIPSEATSRAFLQKKNISPDSGAIHAPDRKPQYGSRPSPLRDPDDPRESIQDSRNTKRRIEENGSSDSGRRKKRSGISETVQLQGCGKERFKETSFEKGRFNSLEVQEHAVDPSKHAIPQKTTKVGELGDSKGPPCSKVKITQGHASANGSCRDNSSNERLPHSTRKQATGSVRELATLGRASHLRGPIQNFQEYKKYSDEYKEKYPKYHQLHLDIEAYKNDFEIFRKDIEQAKRKNDEKKLLYTYGKVKKDYLLKRKNHKQMSEAFQLLHEELMAIKNICKEYAEKVGQG